MAEPKDTEKRSSRGISRNTWLYIGSVVILVIVVVTFIGAPVATSTVGSRRLVFGRYDREEILYQPGNFFARQYEVVAQSLRDSGNAANLELQLRLAWREAFNRTVLHKAVLLAADDAGVTISEEKVDELIAQDPRFLVGGRFDAEAFQNTSNQERFALRNFHRENATFDRVIRDALTATRFSDAEKQFVGEMTGPQRSFQVVRFPFSEFPEEQVAAFLTENLDLFSTLDLSVITLADEDEAANVREQALSPANPFGDLARQYSRDTYADQGGEIGSAYGYELQQELTDPADIAILLSLDEGDTSEPIETTSGWSIYRANAAPAAPSASSVENDEEILAEARSYMEIYEQGRIQDYVRQEAATFATIANTSGLTASAADAGRDVLSTGFFPINYGNVQYFGRVQSSEIPELSDAAFRESFFETAFSLSEGEVSEPVLLRQSALVMQLDEEREVRAEDSSFIYDFYDSIARQFYSEGIETAFVDDEKLDDNFVEAFNRYVLGN